MIVRLLILCVIPAFISPTVASGCNCEEECTWNQQESCGSCKAGWYGPYCQKKNVALNGNASQQGKYKEADAGLAVDGSIELSKCAHTDKRNNSWWSVQLGDNGVNQIRYMKIYNREEHEQNLSRRRGMEISIDGKRCKKWPDNEIPGTTEDVTCSETLSGHNLTITVLGPHYSVCEVQVFVCSDGWFGEDCDQRCKCLYSDKVCDKVTGRCKLGCQAGYTGDDCQTACLGGKYGPDCSSPCGQCADRVCNKVTGDCLGPCVQGWAGRTCNICSDGWFGEDCIKRCKCHFSNDTCDKLTGSCNLGCQAGYTGYDCQTPCIEGKYGPDCSSPCGQCADRSCNKVTGDCLGPCVQGWAGRTCGVCQDGWYGPSCSSTCGHCFNKTVCDKANGDCSWGCSDGWRGRKCDVCQDGWYGPACSSTCGHCVNKTVCNMTNGDCLLGCSEGWRGSKYSRTKWHALSMVVSAVGTGLAFFLIVAGIGLCLLKQGRLVWVKSAKASRDLVQMSDVTSQPEHAYEAPTYSTAAENDIYEVFQPI